MRCRQWTWQPALVIVHVLIGQMIARFPSQRRSR